jgi:hypothetical protein
VPQSTESKDKLWRAKSGEPVTESHVARSAHQTVFPHADRASHVLLPVVPTQ